MATDPKTGTDCCAHAEGTHRTYWNRSCLIIGCACTRKTDWERR